MSEPAYVDSKPVRFQPDLGPNAPTVAELLERQGVGSGMADAWIRHQIFHPLSRFWQAVACRAGFDYCVPEHDLVHDFAQARCTDDIVDALHQYQKMRGMGSASGWASLIRPTSARVLRAYWRLRSHSGGSSGYASGVHLPDC